MTPGFGVQVHSLAAGAFLFTVYNFWSGGMPWGFANSLTTGFRSAWCFLPIGSATS